MRKYFLLFSLILAAFLFYQASLGFYFISDDFIYLSFNSLQSVFSFKPGFYHYNPVFWLLMLILIKIFGLNPFPLHLAAISVHLLNTILVYYLAKLFFKKERDSLVSAALFAFFFSHYEVVFWITGLNTSLMVFFYLLGLISFVKLLKKPKFYRYVVWLLFLFLAIFTHEYAVSLALVCFIYWLFFAKQKKNIIQFSKIFVLPLVIVGFWLILKTSFSYASLVVSHPSWLRFLASALKSSLYLFFPNPLIVDHLPKMFLGFFSVVLLIFLSLKVFANKIYSFIFLWCLTTVIIFSATSLPQARYFYLSSIPAIFLVVSLFRRSFGGRNSDPRRLSRGVGVIYLFFILIGGIFFLQQQKVLWRATSEITKRTLVDIKDLYPQNKNQKDLYFLNLPDSLQGPPWNAYLFRSGLEYALKLNHLDVPGKIYYFRTIPYDEIVRNDPFIKESDLQILKEKGETIFIYQELVDSDGSFVVTY